MKDFFNSNLFMVVAIRYFNMEEWKVVQLLEKNGLALNQKVTLEKFIKIHERNEDHMLFKWMYNFENEYKGIENAEAEMNFSQAENVALKSK